MQRLFSQRFECAFHQVNVQDLRYPSKGRTSSATTGPSFMFSSTHGSQGSNAHTRKTHCVDCGTYNNSAPREIYNVLEATRSSSNRDEELANRVLKDTTITKRQLDLATRLMLEQVSRLSGWNYEQSAMVQLFLDCVDRATQPSTGVAWNVGKYVRCCATKRTTEVGYRETKSR